VAPDDGELFSKVKLNPVEACVSYSFFFFPLCFPLLPLSFSCFDDISSRPILLPGTICTHSFNLRYPHLCRGSSSCYPPGHVCYAFTKKSSIDVSLHCNITIRFTVNSEITKSKAVYDDHVHAHTAPPAGYICTCTAMHIHTYVYDRNILVNVTVSSAFILASYAEGLG